jgi:diguanylate cyclase (GGDEF)-like protein
MKCAQCEEEAAVYCSYKKQTECKTHCTDCNLEKKFAACPHALIFITPSTLSTADSALTFQNPELNEKHLHAFKKTARKFKEEMEIANAMQELEKENSTDHLTQTLSKRRIEKLLEESEEGIVVMIDVDNFKKFNDENGHLKGDEKLKEVAEKIKQNLRKTDFIGRFGGDEFLVLMPNSEQVEAEAIMKRIKEKIQIEAETGITYGLSKINEDSTQALKQADDQLLAKKQND